MRVGNFIGLENKNPFPDFVWWWLLDPEESAEDQLQFNIEYFKKHVVLNKEEICELRTKLLNIHQCFILEHNGAWKPWWCQQPNKNTVCQNLRMCAYTCFPKEYPHDEKTLRQIESFHRTFRIHAKPLTCEYLEQLVGIVAALLDIHMEEIW